MPTLIEIESRYGSDGTQYVPSVTYYPNNIRAMDHKTYKELIEAVRGIEDELRRIRIYDVD